MSKETVTKIEIVNSIYEDLHENVEKQIIQQVIDSFLDTVKDSMIKGNDVQLRGFGTFEPRLRKGREKARNPKNGKEVSVEPHYVAAFRAGKDLKDKMWDLK